MNRKAVIKLAIAIAFCATTIGQGRAQRPISGLGAIEGRVLDSEDRAVSKAKVYAEVVDRPIKGRLPFTFTDEEGRFFLDGLAPATYRVYAVSDEDNLAGTVVAFLALSEQKKQQVAVVEQQIATAISIRLEQKAARLTGRIRDAYTGKPVSDSVLIICREDNPNKCYSTTSNRPDGKFDILVPPVALKVRSTAPGYDDWTYTEDSGITDKADSLRLKSGGNKDVTISLRPQSKSGV